MNSVWIFIIIINTLYLLYYGVVFLSDYYKKIGEKNKDEEDIFEIKDLPTEEAIPIEETPEGFKVGSSQKSNNVERQWKETNMLKHKKEKSKVGQDPIPKIDVTGAVITQAQKKINDTSEEMEETAPKMTSELANETLKSALITGKPPVKIDKRIIAG